MVSDETVITSRNIYESSSKTLLSSDIHPKKKKIPLMYKLVVGGSAGIIGVSSTFPIDIVKTRLQAQTRSVTGTYKSTGPFQVFKSIISKDGIKGLYRGLPPTIIGVVPEKAIKLAVNDYLREHLGEDDNNSLPLSKQVVAAVGAGCLQVIATNPMEIIKIRLQTSAQPNMNAINVIKELGLKGLYKGTTSTLLRDVPYAAIFFPLYSTLKDISKDTNNNVSITSIVAAGCISGATAAALVTPADVIKTRRQMKNAIYTSGYECYKDVIKKEGYGALFKGIFPRMMVQAPLFGITLVAFELQKKYMLESL